MWQCPALAHRICALIAIRSRLAAFQRLSRQIRAHAEAWVKSDICWCASVKTAVSEGMGANMRQYGSVLPLLAIICALRCHASQNAAYAAASQRLSGQIREARVKSDICVVCLGQNRHSCRNLLEPVGEHKFDVEARLEQNSCGTPCKCLTYTPHPISSGCVKSAICM